MKPMKNLYLAFYGLLGGSSWGLFIIFFKKAGISQQDPDYWGGAVALLA